MAKTTKRRSAIKFLFWAALAVGMFALAGFLHSSGKFSTWYYYSADEDGYAVNADTFMGATEKNPAFLSIERVGRISGLQAVPVAKGDRLPAGANGIITKEILEEGARAKEGDGKLTVTIPWQIQDAKGFKFKDTFKHKGVKTYPPAALWNVLIVIGLGITLGYMAEGFTDFIGIKLEKIQHFEGH